MSGLFSFESLSVILPGFLVFKSTRKPLLHFAFPKFSPNQLEFQFIDLIFKLVLVLSSSAIINVSRWTLLDNNNPTSLLALLITISIFGLIFKLSIDLGYLGFRNQVRGRSDPFVIITSFPISIFVLIKANNRWISEYNPIVFVFFFTTLFFTISNSWLSELIEAKLDKPISNLEKIKSATRNFKRSDIVIQKSHQISRILINGISPLILLSILFGPPGIHFLSFVILLISAIAIISISPSLSNSWAVVDSMKSPTIALNQTSVLLRFFRLIFPAIVFWLIGVSGLLMEFYSPTNITTVSTDGVRFDVERLVQSGEYFEAAKLIRGSGIGANSVIQFLPNAETVKQTLGSLASICLTIHAVQTLSNVVIRRLKIELRKYI